MANYARPTTLRLTPPIRARVLEIVQKEGILEAEVLRRAIYVGLQKPTLLRAEMTATPHPTAAS